MSFGTGSRAGGLVQRRNVQQSVTVTEQDEKIDEKKFEEEEDRDSKETRLTLMEEILLLGLKDREVMTACHKQQLYFIKLILH